MRCASTNDVATVSKVSREGGRLVFADYVGRFADPVEPGDVETTSPQVFRVDMLDPNAVIGPHFHDVDQYQLIWRGTGKLGSDPVAPGAFHYADAYTPYGPIVAGQDGLGFFTIRASHTRAAWFMPGSESHRLRRSRRPGFVRQLDLADRAPGVLIGPYPDGVAAYRECAGTSEPVRLRVPAGLGPLVVVVVGGEFLFEGKSYPLWSVISMAPGERTEAITAGPHGVDLLALQFAAPPAPSPLQAKE